MWDGEICEAVFVGRVSGGPVRLKLQKFVLWPSARERWPADEWLEHEWLEHDGLKDEGLESLAAVFSWPRFSRVRHWLLLRLRPAKPQRRR